MSSVSGRKPFQCRSQMSKTDPTGGIVTVYSLTGDGLVRAMKKYLLISLGIVSLSLGILGIFLPLLPTTPFLLLSTFCFYKSSQRLHCWLLNHRIFGRYIRNYKENRAIDSKAKWLTLAILWSTIGFSIYLFWHTVFVPILLLVVAVLVSWHVLSLKTM